ncbi:hypothetical protein RZ54_06590 [Apilactobacillus kunkeei]|uniref:DUF5776 domain-containing protein n=1 Tax=Apilactobacillus kunkeei TaxID=148814 RepID=UPI0006C13C48|nr:DUF5776 domain-containing protein [Apilactobacillus kunkeei]KOY76432.1 hypothetical protein RZ54_06590 [Apilactobacillus kunkeei]
MKKSTNIVSKFAVLVVTLAAGATIASAHVSSHADTLWAPGVTEADKKIVEELKNSKSDNQAQIDAINRESVKHDIDSGIEITQERGVQASFDKSGHFLGYKKNGKFVTTPDGKPLPTKKHSTNKKVVKKAKDKKLFRIRVKAHKVYAYKSIKLQKAGRKVEKKGTKLYVYGIAKKGHKTYYKIYDGRVISADKKLVTKISK